MILQSHPVVRGLYAACGFFFLGLGFLGVVTPGFPGTVFLILSLWFFARSHPQMHGWMRAHPRFGPSLSRWEDTGSIPLKVKWIASICIAVFGFGSVWRIAEPWAAALLFGITCFGLFYVLSRPTDRG